MACKVVKLYKQKIKLYKKRRRKTHTEEKRVKQIRKEEGIQENSGNREVEIYCIIVYLNG